MGDEEGRGETKAKKLGAGRGNKKRRIIGREGKNAIFWVTDRENNGVICTEGFGTIPLLQEITS